MWCGLRPAQHVQVQAVPPPFAVIEKCGSAWCRVADMWRHQPFTSPSDQFSLPDRSTQARARVSSSGRRRVAEPADPRLVAERLAQRLAERQRGVLHGVMRVDLGVTPGPHGHVDAPRTIPARRASGRRTAAGRPPRSIPVPSRSSSTRTWVSLVTRSSPGGAVSRLIFRAPRPAPARGTRPSHPRCRGSPTAPARRSHLRGSAPPGPAQPLPDRIPPRTCANGAKFTSESAAARPRLRRPPFCSSRSRAPAPPPWPAARQHTPSRSPAHRLGDRGQDGRAAGRGFSRGRLGHGRER